MGRHVGSGRLVAALACLSCALMLVRPVGADTRHLHPPVQEFSDAEEPAPGASESRPRERDTRPSRFNLSMDGGLGLIRAASPYTLQPGELALGIGLMNYDRYPGDLDFVELVPGVAVGAPWGLELFFRASPTFRVNSVGQEPFGWPIPPLDVFIDTYPTQAERGEPTLMFAQEAPYKTFFVPDVVLDPPGNGAFSSGSGDVAFGAKLNLLSEDQGARLGLGLRGTFEVPTETPVYSSTADIKNDWREHAGVSGESDFRLDVLLAKTWRKLELLANVGYEWIGDPARGLRVQYVNSAAESDDEFLVGEPIEMKLDLHNELHLHAGMTVPAFEWLGEQLWFLSEFSYTRYVGSGTPVERLVHPAEMRLGIQYNFPFLRSVSFGIAWQLLFNDAGDGSTRVTNLQTADGRGDINFSELADPETSELVRDYFTSRGASFSEGSNKVFLTDNPEFDAWRNIPTGPQPVVGQGGGAGLFYVTWRFGGR